MAERLQKILANTGLGSRRELEQWIAAGKVKRNGQQATLGERASINDSLTVDGRFYRVVADDATASRVLAYHKPLGEITTRSDPENRKTVFDTLPRLRSGRWITVGRLDINTLGLLLLTTDGELANALMHPSTQVQREYAVRVNGRVTDPILERLRSGVQLDDGPSSFERVWADEQNRDSANNWFRVIVREGRNREVRRLWESQGLLVSRLIRVRYGPVLLPKRLGRGRFADLTAQQLADLRQAAGLKTAESSAGTLRAVPVHPRHKRKAARKSRSSKSRWPKARASS